MSETKHSVTADRCFTIQLAQQMGWQCEMNRNAVAKGPAWGAGQLVWAEEQAHSTSIQQEPIMKPSTAALAASILAVM